MNLLSPRDLHRLSLERTQNATDPLSTPPKVPQNVTATVRNLGILVQWARSSGADGYIVLINNSENMAAPLNQVRVPGESNLQYFENIGNATTTRYFAVQAYKGSQVSAYSSVVGAATTQAVADSSIPSDTTYNNADTELTSKTVTTTGGTLFVIGAATLSYNGGNKDTYLRIYEDATKLAEIKALAWNTASGFGSVAIAFNFSTPVAGSHTYKLTAQNNTDASVCTAARPSLCFMEVPMLVMAAPSAPPATPTTPAQPDDVPHGPDRRFGAGY